MKALMLSVLALAGVGGGVALRPSTEASPRRDIHLTFDQVPLDRAFHANIVIAANSTAVFTMPSDQGFVLRQLNVPSASLGMVIAVDGPADTTVNPLAFSPTNAAEIRTFDPPVVVPPGSALNLSVGNAPFGPFTFGIHGYVIHPDEL